MEEKVQDAVKKSNEKKVMLKPLNGDPTLRANPAVFDAEKEASYMKMLHPGGDDVQAVKNKIDNPMAKQSEQKITEDADLIMQKKKELLLKDSA
mmetsp:Transcript_5509/g.7365  ORF Transcript_5509/g.7365 Transcript_5509/m.7365 type:complete len:94 (-) Transcript_5509:862-1143(-)